MGWGVEWVGARLENRTKTVKAALAERPGYPFGGFDQRWNQTSCFPKWVGFFALPFSQPQKGYAQAKTSPIILYQWIPVPSIAGVQQIFLGFYRVVRVVAYYTDNWNHWVRLVTSYVLPETTSKAPTRFGQPKSESCLAPFAKPRCWLAKLMPKTMAST